MSRDLAIRIGLCMSVALSAMALVVFVPVAIGHESRFVPVPAAPVLVAAGIRHWPVRHHREYQAGPGVGRRLVFWAATEHRRHSHG
jgi:hypothetical protein